MNDAIRQNNKVDRADIERTTKIFFQEYQV